MSNTNSYAENLRKLADNSANILAIAEGINEAMVGNDAEVHISEDMSLPSFNNIVKRVERAERTIARFTQGYGVVEADDGTYRKIKASPVSRPPENITGLQGSGEFGINANWFFEDLQYPRCVIKLNLTDKIDSDSDRAYVNRVILDYSNPDYVNFFNANIANTNIGYKALIDLLEKNGISYREDKDEVKLPLTYEKFYGSFAVKNVKLIQDSKDVSRLWYYLDTLNYSEVDANGVVINNTYTLKVGDQIRFNTSLYTVAQIEYAQNAIRLEYAIGYETIGIGDVLEIYNSPFSVKEIEIGIGINEIDIVYVKGVNEEYNLVSKDWSNPLMFITNDLVFEENPNKKFIDYYNENVADFGRDWIAQIKERQIHAYNGYTPGTPVLNADDLQVVQINTQLDATLDVETYNNLTSEIAQTKSNIAAIRSTIATNKDLLIQSTTADERVNIQNLINTDTETLNSLTTQYNSLVEELNTLLNESGAINYTPKYHIRGFFPIPAPVNGETVIGFDIMYRYLHTDETGIKLNTYEYTDVNNILQTGVFTDWNVLQSSLLEKVFDTEADAFIWQNESTADGTKININQIDIPIRSGEKVEIKVRAISEAGYPNNPLKSAWSNSVIISFPDNLTTDDTVTTILDTVKSDMTAVVLQETMSAAGVYTHFADGNSTYKHTAKNISYTDSSIDASGNTSLREMSVQDKIDSLKNILISTKDDIVKAVSDSMSGITTAITELKTIVGYTDVSTGDVTSGTKPAFLAESGVANLPEYINIIAKGIESLDELFNKVTIED